MDHRDARFASELDQAVDELEVAVQPGDVVLTLGAGDAPPLVRPLVTSSQFSRWLPTGLTFFNGFFYLVGENTQGIYRIEKKSGKIHKLNTVPLLWPVGIVVGLGVAALVLWRIWRAARVEE